MGRPKPPYLGGPLPGHCGLVSRRGDAVALIATRRRGLVAVIPG
jgi:hypothetical protein